MNTIEINSTQFLFKSRRCGRILHTWKKIFFFFFHSHRRHPHLYRGLFEVYLFSLQLFNFTYWLEFLVVIVLKYFCFFSFLRNVLVLMFFYFLKCNTFHDLHENPFNCHESDIFSTGESRYDDSEMIRTYKWYISKWSILFMC